VPRRGDQLEAAAQRTRRVERRVDRAPLGGLRPVGRVHHEPRVQAVGDRVVAEHRLVPVVQVLVRRAAERLDLRHVVAERRRAVDEQVVVLARHHERADVERRRERQGSGREGMKLSGDRVHDFMMQLQVRLKSRVSGASPAALSIGSAKRRGGAT
jgi:hypothetical protein